MSESDNGGFGCSDIYLSKSDGVSNVNMPDTPGVAASGAAIINALIGISMSSSVSENT